MKNNCQCQEIYNNTFSTIDYKQMENLLKGFIYPVTEEVVK